MTRVAVALLLILGAGVQGADVSPVQKVVELLDECKAKVEKDLAAEASAMQEYSTFCDDEMTQKGFAIKTAAREILDLGATISDAKATVSELADEISTLSTVLGEKDRQLATATSTRAEENEAFKGSEAEMLKSIDELGRAVEVIKEGSVALLQGRAGSRLRKKLLALTAVVQASGVDVAASKAKLQSLLQATKAGPSLLQESGGQSAASGDEDDDLDFDKAIDAKEAEEKRAIDPALLQQAPKPKAIESSTGGIVETVESMKEKAEDTLSDLRKKEMEDQQSFELVSNGLNNEIAHTKDKMSTATSNKAASSETQSDAEGKLVETEKSKAADEDYSATLKTECETKMTEWEERQKSAKEEMGAIEKAKEILVSGVKEFVQLAVHSRRVRWNQDGDNSDVATRHRLIDMLRNLSRKHHSFALSQIAFRAKADPFGKIRGLIEDMISKLMKEAEEEATQQAFCEEEMGKSKKSKAEKEASLDKYKARIDTAETTIAELAAGIKDLQAEVAEIDKAQTEATAVRQKEKADYKAASSDFKQSAEAVARAIEVLKGYYEGASLIQVSEKRSAQRAGTHQPDFGKSNSDTGHAIISILEMSEEDFTSLLAECETTEAESQKAYDKLTNENTISKATKEVEMKAKESEVKSIKVGLEGNKEDHAGVKAELDAVLSYIEKLKPQCETKVMSYAERKAAREAEISGLKDALEILEGKGLALAQTGRHLRSVRHL